MTFRRLENDGCFTAFRRPPAILLVTFGTQLWLVASASQAASAKPAIADRDITSVVETELRLEKGVSPEGVDVSTSQGLVTLSGTVPNLLAKERTLEIAESIRGVRGVIDRTIVTPVTRSDEDIRRNILAAISQDPATTSYPLAVAVTKAVATMTGVVASNAARRLVERIAKGVKGIKEVRDSITINRGEKRTDKAIVDDVESRLQWDIWLNGDVIKAAATDGNVTLSGRVGSAVAKSRALDDAWVAGATSVDGALLAIEPTAHGDARHHFKYVVKADSDIKLAVLAAFRLDPRVAAFLPEVTVEGGGVILGGSVGNLKARTAAEQDAHNIAGVWRVDNFMKVRPKGLFVDSEMEKQLKAALAWDPLLDSSTIDVAVLNHVAYLSGAVESGLERVEAEDVASRTNGVSWVRNHLKVEPNETVVYDDLPYLSYYDWPYNYRFPHSRSVTLTPEPYLSDTQIKKDIQDSFSWSQYLNRDDIAVAVHGGVATLSGTVGSWIGWREADKDARRIAGVVLNHITVRKGAWW